MKKTLSFLALLLALGTIGRVTFSVLPVDAQVQIANNAAEMSGKIVMLADGGTARTVTNLFTFNRSTSTPFSVNNGAATVPNLLNWSTITITTTGTQNNFAPGLVGNTLVRCNNATLLTITGLTGGIEGQRVTFMSIGLAQVDFAHLNAGSTVSNRLQNTVSSGVTSITFGAGGPGLVTYQYTAATNFWTMVAHEQGAPIAYTPTWAGGAPTIGNGILSGRYYLRGHAVSFTILWNAGGTTTFGAGLWSFGLPTPYAADLQSTYTFSVRGRLAAAGPHRNGTALNDTSNTTFNIVGDNVGAGWGAAVPAAWANGDQIWVTGSYFTQ